MSNPIEQKAIGEILRGIEHPVIVELGAHCGEDATWIMPLCRERPTYVMVEPDINNCLTIRHEHPEMPIVAAAISDHDGHGDFFTAINHKAKNRASGSIKHPTGHLEHFPEVEFHAPVTVAYMTLDTLAVRQDLSRIDLLWVDIQGAERDMIAGGQRTLARTRYMMIEAEPEVELYEGQALKPELIALLPGWEVIEDFGYNLLMRNTRCA